jgi:hypothetical protein
MAVLLRGGHSLTESLVATPNMACVTDYRIRGLQVNRLG